MSENNALDVMADQSVQLYSDANQGDDLYLFCSSCRSCLSSCACAGVARLDAYVAGVARRAGVVQVTHGHSLMINQSVD